MRRAAAAVLAAIALLLAASFAFADGVVLPSRAVVKPVRTPDQRALLAFDGTTETLVVETTLQGEGSEFAWIVPLPAAPKIEESTTGLFPTLAVVTAPRVVDKPKGFTGWTGPLLLGAICFCAWIATRRFTGAVAVGVSVLFAALVVSATTFSCAAHKSASRDTVPPAELSRVTVGAFDVTTVDPGDGSGLRRWLDENGFASPPAVDAVAADYARRGWVFVAAKLRTDESDAVRRIHPLAFTFPAKEAVYPMRLTLAANATCAVELYAFGKGTAEASAMSVAFSGDWLDSPWHDGLQHAEIARLAGELPVTKLTGTLDAAACPGDLALRWGPQREVRPELFTVRAAADRANGAGAWAALLGGVFASVAVGSWRPGPSRVALPRRVAAYGAVAFAACLACYGTWASTEKMPATAERVFGARLRKSTIRDAGGRRELVTYDAYGGERVTVLPESR